jgi:hypothetical protein
MRVVVHSTVALLCCAIGLVTLATTPAPAQLDRGLTPPACSVLSGHPCHPSFCSVFDNGSCFPQYQTPTGQDLRLTIAGAEGKPKEDKPVTDRSESELVDNLQEIFRTLGACWIPPPPSKSQPGMEYTVRFAFKSNGELMAPPRLTYATRGVSEEVRSLYQQAVEAAFKRCTPMHFTKGMAGAIAGHPLTLHFFDNRIVPEHFSQAGADSSK